MDKRTRQHWLPRAYLRPFKAGENDTAFVMDFLAPQPEWRRLGFYDIGNTVGYHALPNVDRALDGSLVSEYARSRDKILALNGSAPLCAVLSETESQSLFRFIQAHAWRSPLMAYRLAMYELAERTVLHPWRLLPWFMPSRMVMEMRRLRWLFFRKGRAYNDMDKMAVIIRRVREMIIEDGHAHLDLRSPAQLDVQLEQMVLEAEPLPWGDARILWSDELLFTMDMPFVLDGNPLNPSVTWPMSPHHLLVAGPARGITTPAGVDQASQSPLELISHLPFVSFSTKLIANMPMDVELLALVALRDESMPAGDHFGYVAVELKDLPYSDRFV